MLNVGDKIPQVILPVRVGDTFEHLDTWEQFEGKRVIIFALPGAFTPTCSNQQLPGYELKADVFKEHGIDQIYCMSVNDSFVMNAWATDQKLENVKVIPDGNGQFTQEMGMLCQKRDKCFGERSWRYAMIVNDGVIEQMFVEPGKTDDTPEDPYGESSPENVLKYLQGFKG